MFLAKVYCCFLIFQFGLYVQSTEEIITDWDIDQKPNSELAEPGLNFTEQFFSFSNGTVLKARAAVYRTLNFNDSMEKILLVKNGTVVKSAFIPLIRNGSGELNSDESKLFLDENILDVTHNGKWAENLTKIKKILPRDNLIIRNGKKYRLLKVRENVENGLTDSVNNKMQRRSFRILPNFLSIIPVKWMTKGMDLKETRSNNGTEWSMLTSSENQKKNNSEENFKRIQNSEKIQKLLNLFTIVKFDNGGCYADGVKGTCLHESECQAKAGKFTQTCAGELGVCCYFEKTCGDVSKENCTYFVNEGFPESSTMAPKVCTLTLKKAHPNVKQLRLDFLIFQLREPTNGTCLQDRLVVSGQDTNDNVPDICGVNTGQHIYINIEDSSGPYVLNIITVGEYFPRNFRIKVTQMGQLDPLLAPKNCLQYYINPTGYVQTFNYQRNVNLNIDEVYDGYFNNLNYAICIKKVGGFCSVSYQNEEESIYPSFQLMNVDEDGERLLPPRQAGAETFDCPDDYIIVNGIRLCGEKLNDATIEMDYTRNYPVTDTSNGPFILSVRTDAAVNGRGFYLKYTQHPCLV